MGRPPKTASRSQPTWSRKALAGACAAFILALGVRLLNLEIVADNPFFTAPIMDEEYHHRWAVDILHGRADEYLPFYRAPGYPYLLATTYRLAGAEVPIGRVLSSIFGAISVSATFLLGMCWGGGVAIISAGAITLMPNSI